RAVRRAMAGLGLAAHAVPRRADRAPAWPEGVTGSITHSDSGCLAAIAPANMLRAIGIDMEPDTPLTAELTELIATPEERRRLLACPDGRRRARMIFAAKEAAYKCQYTLSGRLLDFHDLELEFDPDEAGFEATFTCDVGSFHRGDRLAGRIARAGGHILTCVFIRAPEAPGEDG
ncbi:4'-phosphopantetheinyl transferase superfamily protein, partial [Aquicoccus sp. SCR17]|nr:4'-phosphopantetheinyl transferase superfamily protein [Carideicomes alvinocaridis]